MNLRFRSKTEMKVAEALDRAGVLFLPNCLARLGVTQDYRVNREADFLVVHKGRLGILEIHGEPSHPASRAAVDHDRLRLLKQHGVTLIEVYDATRCYEMPNEVVAEFLRLMEGA
jgi:very-short-patch-repair endonuclease